MIQTCTYLYSSNFTPQVNKQGINRKFLIGNRFHVTLSIVSPYIVCILFKQNRAKKVVCKHRGAKIRSRSGKISKMRPVVTKPELQTRQSCQFLNRVLFRSSPAVMILDNDQKSAISSASCRDGKFARLNAARQGRSCENYEALSVGPLADIDRMRLFRVTTKSVSPTFCTIAFPAIDHPMLWEIVMSRVDDISHTTFSL